MSTIKIGDFVTSCYAGYWQLIDIKPKIATEDYCGETARWKKGDNLGKWVILKKAFTPKMKPRIEFTYVDSTWLRPVSSDVMSGINQYFAEHPDYKTKFDNAQMTLSPMITNCWFNLPEQSEEEFRACLEKLPKSYTMDEFWKILKDYKEYASNPPAKYLLNFLTYPWDIDKKANLLYFDVELIKL